jgi:hypothetical protein
MPARAGARVAVIQDVTFMICVLAFRRGIIGEIGAFFGPALSPRVDSGGGAGGSKDFTTEPLRLGEVRSPPQFS